LAANRGYGDSNEPNDNTGTATNMGTLSEGSPISLNDQSIDDDGDTDYLKFTVGANHSVSITLNPSGGGSYQAGPQNGNGSCTAGSTFTPTQQSDLSFQLIGTNGVTVITAANATGVGGSESITDQDLTSGAGTYYIKVNGAQNATQLYSISVSVQSNGIAGCMNSKANNYNPGATFEDGSCTFDCNSTTGTINSGNVNTSIITDAQSLSTSGTVSATSTDLYWRAGQSIELNENFTINSGAEVTIETGNCVEP
jgi:hypothetical protein